MATTKTINPLHFEDLEPHRFEDLIRQLSYDFRNWKILEATGKLGSDDWFDIRGIELVQMNEVDIDNREEIDWDNITENIWLFQCKREKTITPQKIKNYLNEIISNNENLYGVIFIAPCNFSKKTRDEFYKIIRENWIKEGYMWDKSYLEDILFQPKNDHLLFAYFWISLSVRKRTVKNLIARRLAIKNKLINTFWAKPIYERIVLRNPEDMWTHDYKDKYYLVGYNFEGIKILYKKYYAYIDFEKLERDCVKKNQAIVDKYINEYDEDDNRIHNERTSFDQHKSWRLYIEVVVLYDNIINIDKHWDEYADYPHIYINYKWSQPIMSEYSYIYLDWGQNWKNYNFIKEFKRINIFSKEFNKYEVVDGI